LQTQTPRSERLGFFHKKVAAGWLYLSIAIALMQFAYTYRPRLSVEAGVAVDERDPMATLFRVTNTGPWHLNNVRFKCNVWQGGRMNIETSTVTVLSGSGSPTGQEPVEVLAPGATATRDCVVGASPRVISMPLDPAVLGLDITAEYQWPYFWFRDSLTRHFSTRRLANGRFILVQDVQQ
jgi:hypothetical protein